MSCIKTGGYFYLSDFDSYFYGDLHSIGNCFVLYHTGKQHKPIDMSLLDGIILSNPEWFDRDTKPYAVIVFPKAQFIMSQKLKDYLRN